MEVLFKKVFEKYYVGYHHDHTNVPTNEPVLVNSFDDLFQLKGNNPELYDIVKATDRHPFFKFVKSSNNKEDFEKEYANPLCAVIIHRLSLIVEKDDDKVSIKAYQFSKSRQEGKPYFKKAAQMKFITYKFKNNNLYVGQIINGFKKRKFSSSVRVNNFFNNPFQSMEYLFHNAFTQYKKDVEESAKDITKNAITFFLNQIPDFKFETLDNVDDLIYEHYLKTRGIKFPNNFKVFRHTIPLPNKRVLKKNGNKLLDSFMFNKKLEGDKIKKVLHQVTYVNEPFYREVESLFGKKFLKHQSVESLVKIFENKSGYVIPGDENTFSDGEKKNVFSVFVSMIDSYSSLQTFIDHINFYLLLSRMEGVKWKSYDKVTFRKEHEDWSDKYSHYTKGNYTRKYDDIIVDKVQQPILNTNLIEYYPVVLKTSSEYNSESNRQSNCVKTYIDKASAFIISLREGSPYSDERATIEYRIFDKGDGKVGMKRVQSLGRFNNQLDVKWNLVLEELDGRVDSIINKYEFTLPKVIVDYGQNRILESDSKFSDKSYSGVVWTSEFLQRGGFIGGNMLGNDDLLNFLGDL